MRVLQTMGALALAAAILGGTGCTTAPAPAADANAGTNAPTTTAPATPAPAPAAALGSSAASLPLTLPVLDAMFADEAFAGELKSKLQLPDEQVERLRAVAREETSGLQEGTGEEYAGSTAEATARASQKIREVIGEQKTQQFASFVRERWEGGGAAAAPSTQPNSVPTDTRIVVNAPAYRMDVYENGRLVKTYKVGIGYPEFPLPQGLRQASSIIFNPTWTPPDEPWVRGKVQPGKKVEAGSKLNPLGPVKIPIGLPSLIHGGKSPARLGTFASHGCVGLTSPQVLDFSQVLARLGGAELTPEDVAGFQKNKTETKNVKLSNNIPVELRYETIVVEDGRLHIYRDVYDKGTNTEENLRAVLAAHGVSLDSLSPEERAQVSDALREMARDASGNPTDGTPNATPSPTPGKDAKKGKVQETRTIKGRKEVVIDIAALSGKGYPAPVNLDSGTGQPQKQKQAAATAPAKKRGQ